MRPVGIGETNSRTLAKIVIRLAGLQAKTMCGNLQLCTGLEAGIEGATHAVGQRRLERSRERQSNKEVRSLEEEEVKDTLVVGLNNLAIETEETEKEAAYGLMETLQMEIEEEWEVESGGEEEFDGTQGAMGALEFLTQDA